MGNPNSGKTTLFNNLTGLRQKVGNYPGVTVDKKVGTIRAVPEMRTRISDLPGTYSLYPNSSEELIVSEILVNKGHNEFPDAIICVCDVTSIQSQLLLFTQVADLMLPTILVLNMGDEARRKGFTVRKDILEKEFRIPCVEVNSRTREGYDLLYTEIEKLPHQDPRGRRSFYEVSGEVLKMSDSISKKIGLDNPYQGLLLANHLRDFQFLTPDQSKVVSKILEAQGFKPLEHQINETLTRYKKFEPIARLAVDLNPDQSSTSLTHRLDKALTHRIWGLLIFVLISILIFQSIYSWSEAPMAWIENGFAGLSGWIQGTMGTGWLSNLITEGILAGISGVLVFIPQIAILFFLITLLEESGYMARAVFLCDRIMQVFGLNGRSIIALISGGACAIPAIISTRTISNLKERLITIMVTPLISCSARLPVYVILVGLAIPSTQVLGIFNLQGLVFAGLYILGILAALFVAFGFHKVMKVQGDSYLTLELPNYRKPHLRNVFLTVYEKVKVFVIEAGKIIFFISIILWFLSSYSFPGAIKQAETEAIAETGITNMGEPESTAFIASRKLEASFAGRLGKMMEPAIEPLGYDWKIGIALLTSFAAREVFVGTMATIYSVGNDDSKALRDKLRDEVNLKTGKKVFAFPTALSLMLFYAFAMQCMSTLAVVKRETNSWKWPIIQFVYMSVLAYVAALVAYQVSAPFFV